MPKQEAGGVLFEMPKRWGALLSAELTVETPSVQRSVDSVALGVLRVSAVFLPLRSA